jgi:uncharacterized protein YndB with AHSA1/START domain
MTVKLNGNLTVRRTIGAPAHDVFAAWTKAELMTRWGVDEFTADARPGGHYRQVTRDDTDEHVVSGEYREFVPDERLVMTWIYEGPDPDSRSETLVTVDLDERSPGTTELTVTEAPLRGAEAAAAQEAWTAALTSLEALLERR